ncbi:hypothetical protein AMECASPLE_006914 [Ameca splendens]|uniref:Uncharacterized protein n=1 Tax=Ameca splendens TaxID=208324 RepID=A0ABV0XCL7_9TELE
MVVPRRCWWWQRMFPTLERRPKGALLKHSTIALFHIGSNVNHREPILCITHSHQYNSVLTFVIKIVTSRSWWSLDFDMFSIKSPNTIRKVPQSPKVPGNVNHLVW